MKMETSKEFVDELTRVYITKKTGFVDLDTVDRMLRGLPGMLRDLQRFSEVVAAQAKGGLTEEWRSDMESRVGSTLWTPAEQEEAATTLRLDVALQATATDLAATQAAALFLWNHFPDADKEEWWRTHEAEMDTIWAAVEAASEAQ